LRKLQRVKRDYTRDATARAHARRRRAGIRRNVRKISDECGQRDQSQIAARPQKILHIVTEHEKKIHIPDEVDDAGVQKKRADERKATQPRGLGWYQAEARDNFVQVREREYAPADDGKTKHPRRPWLSLWFRRIEFNWHSTESRDLFPPVIRRRAVEIAAARFFGHLFHLHYRDRLT